MAQKKNLVAAHSAHPVGATMSPTDWKKYEREIHAEFHLLFPDAQVLWNQKLEGRSGKMRQIDVLIRDRVAGRTIDIVVDGKCFNRKVGVGVVESFAGLVRDVRADRGILVTNVGYTSGALERAQSEERGIELDILTTDPINSWMFQSKWAYSYVDSHGVLLTAPFGWVVDGKRRHGGMPGAPLAYLYQRGISLDLGTSDAHRPEPDQMYVNIWPKSDGKIRTMKQLLDKQEALFERYPSEIKVEMSYVPMTFFRKDGADMRLRKARIDRPGFPIVLEYGGFVDFPDFIFFAILLTAEETALVNCGKLEYVMERIIPLHMEHFSGGVRMSAMGGVSQELRDALQKMIEFFSRR